MLKYFYKTFLISILCGSLLMLDMSYKAGVVSIGMNNARAESVSTGGVEDQNLMSTLTMVGISVIASRLVLYGTLTTDIMLAAAGGLAFIAGDMVATSKLKEAKKKIETEIQRGKNGDITDEQRQSLMRLLNMYKASKEAAETKKNLQLAAAAAFAAAAIAAYMASAKEAALTAVCATTTAAVTSAATAALAGVYTSAAASACLTAEGTATTPKTTYVTGREVPSPSCASITSVMPSWMGGTTTNKTAGSTCTTFGGAAQLSQCELMYTDLKFNEPQNCVPPGILLATTAATVLLMGITASTIITAVVNLSGPLSEMIDMAIFTPKRRAIVWGVLAGLAFASSSSTSSVIEQINSDIKKIENLLNTINAQAQGTLASNSINKPNSNVLNVKPNDMIIRENNTTTSDVQLEGGKLPCITNQNKSGVCPSVSSTLQNSVGFNNLPDGFKTDVLSIGQAADGLNGTSSVSASTLNSANSIGANAARLLNGLKKTKEDFQGRLIASKSKTNINDEEKKFKDSMNKAFKDAMVKSKTNSKALIASYGVGSGMGELSKATEEAAKLLGDKMPKGIGDFKMPAIATPEIPAMPNYAQGSDSPSADELAKMENADEANKSGTTMDDYEIKTDITRDSKENIFDVISKRYKKSGYPRLFKRLAE